MIKESVTKSAAKKDTLEVLALLTISEFPKTKQERTRLASWLNKVADQIYDSKPADYAKSVKFRLMK